MRLHLLYQTESQGVVLSASGVLQTGKVAGWQAVVVGTAPISTKTTMNQEESRKIIAWASHIEPSYPAIAQDMREMAIAEPTRPLQGVAAPSLEQSQENPPCDSPATQIQTTV